MNKQAPFLFLLLITHRTRVKKAHGQLFEFSASFTDDRQRCRRETCAIERQLSDVISERFHNVFNELMRKRAVSGTPRFAYRQTCE